MTPATACHAAAMAAIHATCFDGADRWATQAIADLLATPGCFGLIDPAGGFILARLAGGEAEVLTLAVIPAERRHGMARGLLVAALACIGTAPVFLEVAVGNFAALALYGSQGFARCGTRARYYADGSDALVLRRG